MPVKVHWNMFKSFFVVIDCLSRYSNANGHGREKSWKTPTVLAYLGGEL